MKPNQENLSEACSSELFAAEAAYKLVREQGMSFRDAYRKVASEPELSESFTFKKLLKQQNHLGSAGNPGIERLRKLLKELR